MLVPKPALLLFAAFQFDPEAAKDIDEMKPELAGMQFLKVQMNADLLTDDLKKKRASNESFWLIGQPDVEVQRITSGSDKDKLRVVVHGFDYYNTKTGNVESAAQTRSPSARHRLRRAQPLPASGLLPNGRRTRRLGKAGKEPQGRD
ncbi:hypothetical protein [Chloracidobacterium aggregatum]|uniref:hypothetical protein n=1 Tax=Chloracidobacterium aggregatum TaxID=2851959 RepID=UPI001B8CE95D|nr:hypothetical protein J8C04_11550 [Chloracidobacterium sp. A]